MNYAAVINRAQAAGVQLVRFLYCDHSGVTRGKAIHVSHLEHKLREGLGLTRAQMAMNLLEQLIDIEGMEPVGEIRLVPDPETFSVLPWTPSSASLICDQLDHNHRNWGSCPRSFLKDQDPGWEILRNGQILHVERGTLMVTIVDVAQNTRSSIQEGYQSKLLR